ncbi:MAG: 30S ribosomal protein S3 [Candidatus Methanomethylicia archaeon]|jgi:small subunit ribosomal protein S3|uniref:Small ribosomal subunit protein uS3 n=1 Tax=Thermoproteota archaeon TaxID=2056631 RepID=A0A520KEA5_9CREN|nr:30S ribosomal protein S3 [Candidatus Methanomethylicia archaeon]MCQ5340278.1 30S ribosomal protein S3 [Candidatus Methanomethylicia archaeon]RZN55393.1 MAG: 30S ribosomal protein S3 [Candidatus Verstraetearchaeota archaeon]TDA38394.1 MAG: 30S ribosomal protein S3 [Candidatus Verstraetearchaeota archaeon]
MSVTKYFISKAIKNALIDDYLQKELRRAGYAGVDFQRTPLGNRVIIYAERPGLVIGRQGATIRELAHILEMKFGLENPQIAVVPVQNPELNAKIMANRIAMALERGIHFRRAAFVALRQIMEAGARGAEIVIRGKLVSERARYEKFRAGVILKAGEPSMYAVDKAVTHVLLKPGVYGIKVKIFLPVNTVDDISIVRGEEVGNTQTQGDQKHE